MIAEEAYAEVERRHAEPTAILRREVDPPQREVARHILQKVDELEPGADVVAERDGLVVVKAAQDTEHEAAAGIGRVDAVVVEVIPRLVLGDPLVDSVRLDQPQERLARQVERVDRRLQID